LKTTKPEKTLDYLIVTATGHPDWTSWARNYETKWIKDWW
jgi:hypothetical protein